MRRLTRYLFGRWNAIRYPVFLFALLPALVPAQAIQSRPEFDVISIKAAPPEGNDQYESYCANGGRFIARGTPLEWTIQFAYDINDYQLGSAWPDWITAFHTYDIEATAEKPVSEDECRKMVQSLLEERFHLRLRREMKTASAYALMVGKNGPRLGAVARVTINGALKQASFEREAPPGWTMARLANYLASVRTIQRPVVDRTNLNGLFGFTLNYAVSDGDDRPGIFLALREQLGLRLESVKAPIELWFVDSAERPRAN